MNSSVERFRWSSSDSKLNGAFFKEDSATKLTPDEELDVGDAILCKSSLKDSSFIFEGVRFSPKVIEFIDAFEGKQFAEKITIQNIGVKPVMVKIGEPNSFIFQIKKPSRRVRLLASGTSLTKTITYSYHNDDLVQRSQIPIQINGRFIDYPIVVKKAVPEIAVEPTQLDFKQINLGASAKTMMLTIHNSGGQRTKFEIDLGKNDLDLVVHPLRGTIKAKSTLKVFVEMMGMTEGEYFKELWVTTSEMSTRVPIIVEVVTPRLEIIHPNVTEDLVLIDFPPTFVKTQRAESFLLKNYSAETTLFIALAEIGGNLQFVKNARKVHEICKMFMFTTEEGRLEPFESRVLTVLFRPKKISLKKGWSGSDYKKKKDSRMEHILFVRMVRVHCIEIKELAKVEARPAFNSIKETSSSQVHTPRMATTEPSKILPASQYVSELLGSNPELENNGGFFACPTFEEKFLRLCLHGTAVEPKISLQPSCFEFELIYVGKTEKKVLKITNESIIAVKYRIHKMMNSIITPNEGWLKPDQALEFLIAVTPTCSGKFQTNIRIEIFGKSDVVSANDRSLVSILHTHVPVTYVASVVSVNCNIKMDSGVMKELPTFRSCLSKPKPPVPPASDKSKKPHLTNVETNEKSKMSNALVHITNVRPKSCNSWDKDDICQKIMHKDSHRYVPVESNHHPPPPLQEAKGNKQQHNEQHLKEVGQSNIPHLRITEENLIPKETTSHKFFHFGVKQASYVNALRSRSQIIPKKTYHHQHNLVPLSPQDLNNINVEPKLINFGTVAVSTLVQEILTVHNMNPFPIGIRFVPGKSAVKVVEGETIVVPPLITKSLPISFQTKDLGRHYGFLEYLINGSHQFKITISAFVTPKTLMLEDKNLVIQIGKDSGESAFQPLTTFLELGNLLQSPIKYHWRMPSDSAFTTDIMEGEVPPKTQLLTEIKITMRPGKSFYSEFTLVSESGSTEIIKLIYPIKSAAVTFLTNVIDMKDIPLNLPTKVTPVIRNSCYHEVVFEVLNWDPMPGVVIEPKQGVLRPRSFFPLQVNIQIPVIMTFSFDVVVFIHQFQKINCKITGTVVLPKIKIKPTELVMRKICSQSFDTATLCIENAGTTPAEINIDFEGCPEYNVVDNKSRIFLPPLKHKKLKINFQPTDVARFVFYLPIIINRILGPPILQQPESEFLGYYISSYENIYEGFGDVFHSEYSKLKIPCTCINSTVSPSLLKISRLNIIFDPVVNPALDVMPQKIVISNDFTENVTFCIRNDDLGETNNSPFDLVPIGDSGIELRSKSIKAELSKGSKMELNATFKPKRPGFYEVSVPIFIKDYNNGVVFNYIHLKGEFKEPRIYAGYSEVHFPPLPLSIGCEVVVPIFAENFTTSEKISCFITSLQETLDSSSRYLSFIWLNEPKVIPFVETQEFQLQITFSSEVPIALRNYLLFIDTSGNYCSVLVTAISDNASITNHAFLSTQTSKYKVIKDITLHPHTKADMQSNYSLGKSMIKQKNGSKKNFEFSRKSPSRSDNVDITSVHHGLDFRVIVNMTKSMMRPTQISFVNPVVNSSVKKNKDDSSALLTSTKSKLNSTNPSDLVNPSDLINPSDVYLSSISNDNLAKVSHTKSEITYPNFPFETTSYGCHFQETLRYLEKWIFEVIMQCEQFFTIPRSFQKIKRIRSEKKDKKHAMKIKTELNKGKTEKDFLDLLDILLEPSEKENFPQRARWDDGERVLTLCALFSEILRFLSDKGCLLSHIKPEYLLNYEDYVFFTTNYSSTETFKLHQVPDSKKPFKIKKDYSTASHNPTVEKNFDVSSLSLFHRGPSWRKLLLENFTKPSDIYTHENTEDEEEEAETFNLEGKQFSHQFEIFDKTTLEARSTQAWFDIIIQVAKIFVLNKLCYPPAIPDTEATTSHELVCIDSVLTTPSFRGHGCHYLPVSLDSNLHSAQERTLLAWLNHHFNEARKIFCDKEKSSFGPRIINNFDKDLADSLVLIFVTAAHCPYIISEYFSNIFLKPDTHNKLYHNASKLALAWKVLNIGLTIESSDLVNPNPVFMLLLVLQLYKILPVLHPRIKVNFNASLSSESIRTIQIRNVYEEEICYQMKFIGEFDGFFRIKNYCSNVKVRPMSATDIQIVFTARKIKKAVENEKYVEVLTSLLNSSTTNFRQSVGLLSSHYNMYM